LEATRSDTWSDPNIAPEFARWRRHGVYVPRAVAQYPATPLAYGAIFTSHPPSIVAQSSHWSRRRLFVVLAPRFRTVFLSQPGERWFDTGAMTSFIVQDAASVRRHTSTGVALSGLKELLAGEAGKHSFFAWVHLFDPHRPYQARGKTPRTAPIVERYRSEVHAVDTELGAFMRWFYGEPLAARTLVIVVADHGQAMGEVLDGEPYFGHHVHVADSIVHIPFFASGPGLPANVTELALGVSQLDVMPTIFDHLGVALPAALAAQGLPLPKLLAERPVRSLPTEAFSIRGREFFAFLARGGRADVAKQRRLFRGMWETGTYPPKLALERDGWKLVRDVVVDADALYDLRADPRETKDVAAERPAELRAMQAAVETWSRSQVNVLHRLDRVQ
ncbi:MAG TPA: sulfatase-like hydrolase/transferase, partial [Polyangiaceae bacterium]